MTCKSRGALSLGERERENRTRTLEYQGQHRPPPGTGESCGSASGAPARLLGLFDSESWAFTLNTERKGEECHWQATPAGPRARARRTGRDDSDH